MSDPRAFCINRNQHTAGSSSTPWTLGKGERTEVIVHRRGIQVKRRCLTCNTIVGPIPKDSIWEWFGDLGELLVRDGYADPYPACSYVGCERPGADLHHFAPRNTFGWDADNWPVMPLCQIHHREWHQRMNGYIWHRKAVS